MAEWSSICTSSFKRAPWTFVNTLLCGEPHWSASGAQLCQDRVAVSIAPRGRGLASRDLGFRLRSTQVHRQTLDLVNVTERGRPGTTECSGRSYIIVEARSGRRYGIRPVEYPALGGGFHGLRCLVRHLKSCSGGSHYLIFLVLHSRTGLRVDRAN